MTGNYEMESLLNIILVSLWSDLKKLQITFFRMSILRPRIIWLLYD
jgi:hypothetical protein